MCPNRTCSRWLRIKWCKVGRNCFNKPLMCVRIFLALSPVKKNVRKRLKCPLHDNAANELCHADLEPNTWFDVRQRAKDVRTAEFSWEAFTMAHCRSLGKLYLSHSIYHTVLAPKNMVYHRPSSLYKNVQIWLRTICYILFIYFNPTLFSVCVIICWSRSIPAFQTLFRCTNIYYYVVSDFDMMSLAHYICVFCIWCARRWPPRIPILRTKIHNVGNEWTHRHHSFTHLAIKKNREKRKNKSMGGGRERGERASKQKWICEEE